MCDVDDLYGVQGGLEMPSRAVVEEEVLKTTHSS